MLVALLLPGVMATTDFAAAACGVSIAILCGGVPKRGPGLLSKTEVMAANCAIYRDQAAALAAHAAPGVKVSHRACNSYQIQVFASVAQQGCHIRLDQQQCSCVSQLPRVSSGPSTCLL